MTFVHACVWVVVLMGTALVTCTGSALAYCSEPSEPNCPILGRFTSELDFDMCKGDVEQYVRDVHSYVNCLYDEADQAQVEGQRKVDNVIEKFNCHARGETICF